MVIHSQIEICEVVAASRRAMWKKIVTVLNDVILHSADCIANSAILSAVCIANSAIQSAGCIAN